MEPTSNGTIQNAPLRGNQFTSSFKSKVFDKQKNIEKFRKSILGVDKEVSQFLDFQSDKKGPIQTDAKNEKDANGEK